MRIVSHNLYNGAQDTYSELQEFVTRQNADILCLQEANGWHDGTPSRLEDFSAKVGLPYTVFGDSNTRFKLATLSRLPILSSEVITDGFWHSAVRTTVGYKAGELDAWNVHLNPKNEDARKGEIHRLIERIDPSRLTIITGDFNSLSIADQYPDDMVDVLAAQGITKFGIEALRYDVTRALHDAEFVDAALELGVATNTVPTPANQDKFHATEMRLDYMFVTEGLVGALERLETIKSPLTDVISDHYPNVMDIK